MSIRISFGSYWFEIWCFEQLLGSLLLLEIRYGHNSTKNLVRLDYFNDHPSWKGFELSFLGKRRVKRKNRS